MNNEEHIYIKVIHLIMAYNLVSNKETNEYNVYFNINVRILHVIHIFVIFKRFTVPHTMLLC